MLRGLFRWMVRENALLANPAADLIRPRAEKRLPRAVLSPLEADQVINQPDTHEHLGLRDRGMLETLYSAGMRGSEDLPRFAGEDANIYTYSGDEPANNLDPDGDQYRGPNTPPPADPPI